MKLLSIIKSLNFLNIFKARKQTTLESATQESMRIIQALKKELKQPASQQASFTVITGNQEKGKGKMTYKERQAVKEKVRQRLKQLKQSIGELTDEQLAYAVYRWSAEKQSATLTGQSERTDINKPLDQGGIWPTVKM